MKVQKHAISLACLAALGFAGNAQAVQVAGEALEVYGNMYPQYQVTNFSDAAAGGERSNMTTGTLAAPSPVAAASKQGVTQINWVNSYVGFKGQKAFGDVNAGFDMQSVVMANGTASTEPTEQGAARDAFLFISHKAAGTLQVGQMDTILKEFGDRVRMLGVSSSNFVATSSIMLGTTWKTQKEPTAAVAPLPANQPNNTNTAGVVTFNTRINGQLRWISPNWNGVEVGFSYRPDPAKSATSDASLQSYGVRWSNPTYYVGLATEVHNDYRAFSGNNGANGIYNAATTRSKDTATRLTFGYTAAKYRIGADVSSLQYTEDGLTNGFESYKTTAWQVSGEYEVTPQIIAGANYARGAAGTCTIVGGATCTTAGLGGSLLSAGVRYNFDKNIGLFAIYGLNSVNSSAVLASGNTGGNVTNMAVGVQVKF